MDKPNWPANRFFVASALSLLATFWIWSDSCHFWGAFLFYSFGWFCFGYGVLLRFSNNEKVMDWLTGSPIRFYVSALASCFLIILFLDLYFIADIDKGKWEFGDKWDNIVVEAHGLLFDLVVLGVLLTAFENYRKLKEEEELKKEKEREQRILQNVEMIRDLKNRDNEETKQVIIDAIKQLNKDGHPQIILDMIVLDGIQIPNGLCLNNAILIQSNFMGANLMEASFINAKIRSSKFSNQATKDIIEPARLNSANFQSAKIYGSILNGAVLRNANFTGAEISKTEFRDADLRGAVFMGANVVSCDFENARILFDFISESETWGIVGENFGKKYRIVESPRGSGEYRLKGNKKQNVS